jgi:hypothetical protein
MSDLRGTAAPTRDTTRDRARRTVGPLFGPVPCSTPRSGRRMSRGFHTEGGGRPGSEDVRSPAEVASVMTILKYLMFFPMHPCNTNDSNI